MYAAHLMVQLARGEHGQHVAFHQQTMQQRQVAGLDSWHWRIRALTAEEAPDQFTQRCVRTTTAPSTEAGKGITSLTSNTAAMACAGR